ncbi:hypothetical protein C6501_03410 [Candidatus Poribacteria bacterium]|nr:MAG: hypothetical protein C6501_03410 [Candidatus Poribacteria bacterium]
MVLLGLGASVALADEDDLDALIELEDQVKARFDHLLNLRKIKYILDGVSSACLEHRCFEEGKLKIRVETNCQDCRVDVDLGGVESIVPANGEWKLLEGCIKIGKPGNCYCQSLTRLHIDKQLNAQNIIIKVVELSLVTADGSKPIFKGERRRLNRVAYELADIKNSDTFMRAKVGSCQN